MAVYTLGKTERLKSRTAIQSLFQKGKKLYAGPYRVVYIFTTVPGELQFGVNVSKRYFKKAVARNRIKRLTKEAWRLQKLPLQELLQEKSCGLQVFFLYNNNQLPVYEEIAGAAAHGIKQLLQQLNKKP